MRKIIAGPTVFICDECIKICNEILADDALLAETAQQAAVNVGTFTCPKCRTTFALHSQPGDNS